MPRTLLIALCALFLCLPLLAQSDRPGVRSWAQFRGDALNTGVSHSAAPKMEGIAWKFFTAGPVTSTPAVHEGVVYVCTELGHVHAVRAEDGKKVWSKLLGAASAPGEGAVFSSPLVIDDLLVVGRKSGGLKALRLKDGETAWSWSGKGSFYGSPKTDGERIFAVEVVGKGEDQGILRAFDAKSGKELWERPLLRESGSSAAVFGDLVYVAARDKFLWEVSAKDGSVRRRIQLSGTTHATPTIALGYAYLVTGDRRATAIDLLSGEKVWDTQATSEVKVSIAYRDGVVYLPLGAYLQAHEATTGKKLWAVQARHKVAPPCVLATGEVYMGGRDGVVRQIDPKDGAEVRAIEIGQGMIGGPVVCGGKLFVATMDNYLYCIR